MCAACQACTVGSHPAPPLQAAGLQFGMLAPDELSAAFPRLRPPRGSAALYTNAGGVVNGQLAAAVLRAMAQRAGAVAAPACLLGWRDAGGHFALRTAPLSAAAAGAAAAAGVAGPGIEGELVYECEQLVSGDRPDQTEGMSQDSMHCVLPLLG